MKEKEIKGVLKIQAEQILQFEACEEYKQAVKGLQDRLWAIYSAGFEDGFKDGVWVGERALASERGE